MQYVFLTYVESPVAQTSSREPWLLHSLVHFAAAAAKDLLGVAVERPVRFGQPIHWCGMCGTAAVISPVGKRDGQKEIVMPVWEAVGPVASGSCNTPTSLMRD